MNIGKRTIVSLAIGWMLCLFSLQAQISHGGKPLPLSPLRSEKSGWFEEMPAFDVAEELRIDSLNESDLRSGHRFAYKFMTHFTPDNSGIHFVLPDGTKVWRLGIRSAGAFSINLLFTDYRLPEGAQLFLYDPLQRQVLGSFDHRNNSDLNLLPVAPVWGDEVIVEYQEPARVAFKGELTIGEVNHAYRHLRGGPEPKEDQDILYCVPSVSCYAGGENGYDHLGRSVVMLIINGSVSCTGVLMNNSQGDGKPYVLTASHCLNGNFTVVNPDYAHIAGTIVSFFNYDSPLCKPKIKGAEEMSMASMQVRAVNEQHDMALLELLEMPPQHYRPYYAGWNIQAETKPPYACIQHPKTGTKSVAVENDEVKPATFQFQGLFREEAHLLVEQWNEGCTADGSSGAPLFDGSHLVVGALSGGRSYCEQPTEDYFYSLRKVWTASAEPFGQLKHWLDSSAASAELCQGTDPYGDASCQRLSNVLSSGRRDEVENTRLPQTESEPLFGNNSVGVTACLESYDSKGKAQLCGVYLVTPPAGAKYTGLKVKVVVYEGALRPERLLYSESFQPTYCNKLSYEDSFQQTPKSLNVAQESYVHFSQPVAVDGRFYVGYEIEQAPEGCFFSAFNLPKGSSSRNTTWMQVKQQWIEANQYGSSLFNTSLFVDPLIRYAAPSGIQPVETEEVQLIQLADRSQLQIVLPGDVTKATYTIWSADGRLCDSGQLSESRSTLPTHQYPMGVYMVCVSYADKYFTRKMIF